MEGNKKEEREEKNGPITSCHVTPARGGRVGHTGPETLSSRGAHGSDTAWATWPLGHSLLSRAPSHSLAVSWASELRF